MIHLRRCLAILFGGVWILSALPSLGQDDHTVSIVADEYEFRGPDRILPGRTTIEIVNEGQELHHIQVVRLPPGKTPADFAAELKASPSKLPGWIIFAGGPNAVTPGAKARATMNLEPGDYLLLCMVPTHTGAPHLSLGMVKSLQVRGSVSREAVKTSSGPMITLLDYGFSMPQTISSGTQTIQVTNRGKVPHEVLVVQLSPDKSVSDFSSFAEKPIGHPPGKPMGGMVGLDNGRQGSFTVDFQPGKYGLICFFPDPETGLPHYRRGMLSEFIVK